MDPTHRKQDPTSAAPAPDDTLITAEALLLRLGDAIPDPLAQDGHEKLYACLMAHRARSLYANFLHSLGSPAEIAPILALRPLVEAAILAKWISLDPTLHGELWFAHAEDRELTSISEVERHLGVRVRGEIPASEITESVEAKVAWRDEAVARAKAAGKRYGDHPMPHLDRLVQEIERREPGHRVAMRQASDLAFRGFGAWCTPRRRPSRPRPSDRMRGWRRGSARGVASGAGGAG